ncbi:MAG: N-formylglutamate deformylase [Aquincola sp.]|nr:N-formylglutamate deformylase [Aquincola sp.]MDH4289785.1 N-formylglutamate deformylase [Aquincola sp.]
MTSDICTLQRGTTPLLVSVPHAGTRIPDELAPLYVERALAVEDTDWHLDAIYDFTRDMGASLLLPRHSRYVIDLNRPPENTPMYPGVNNTELCPTRFFTGEPLYRPGQAPDAHQVAARLARYWQPYHDALAGELARLKAVHGYALLWDGHSIASQLPWLFDGRLSDLNLGTASGASCAPSLRAALMAVLDAQQHFSHVTDGRFKGGYITRTYGRPADRVHAVQMEMCFSTYMTREAPPWTLDAPRVSHRLQPLLLAMLQAMLDWRPGD